MPADELIEIVDAEGMLPAHDVQRAETRLAFTFYLEQVVGLPQEGRNGLETSRL